MKTKKKQTSPFFDITVALPDVDDHEVNMMRRPLGDIFETLRRLRFGSDIDRQQSWRALTKEFEPRIEETAGSFRARHGGSFSMEQCVVATFIGFTFAMEQFNFILNEPFPDYLSRWMQRGLRYLLEDDGGIEWLPKHLLSGLERLQEVCLESVIRTGQPPTTDQVRQLVKVNTATVNDLLFTHHWLTCRTLSLPDIKVKYGISTEAEDDPMEREGSKVDALKTSREMAYSDIDRALAVMRYRKKGCTMSEIASEIFECSTKQLQRLIRLLEMPQVLQDAVKEGRILTTHALVLDQLHRRYGNKINLDQWIDVSLTKRLSVNELRREVLGSCGEKQNAIATSVSIIRNRAGHSVLKCVSAHIPLHGLNASQRRGLARHLRAIAAQVEDTRK